MMKAANISTAAADHPQQNIGGFLASIVKFSDDAIITKDLDGTITTWNRAAEKIFGYTAEEAIGNHISILIPHDHEGEELWILSRLRNGEFIDHYETMRRSKDGSVRNVSVTVSPIKDKDGNVVGAAKIARDFTPQKRVLDYSRFLAAVVESSDDAIITKDLNSIITSWNKGAENIFGYTVREAVGKPIAILIPPDRESEEPDILKHLCNGERIDHYETVRRHKNGSLIHVSLTVSPVRDSQGTIIGASKIARDITRGKLREQEMEIRNQLVAYRTASLERALAQMEEFSYSVSHDLKAPIRAMKGYALAIQQKYGDQLNPDVRANLQRIIDSGERMEHLVQDVLTYSRVARTEIRLQPVALDKLVPDIVEQYPAMQAPEAEICVHHPLIPVIGHEPTLTQAISNLLANGVKFVSPGVTPKIKVWTEPDRGNVRLWVEDNGIGIKPEYQNRLFGMFERVHRGGDYAGTGIGLAIVRKAVEKMGGQVGVKSDGRHGAAFWIELPGLK